MNFLPFASSFTAPSLSKQLSNRRVYTIDFSNLISIQFLPRASPPSCEAVISPLKSVIPSFASGRTPPGSVSSAPVSASASDAHDLLRFRCGVYRGRPRYRTSASASGPGAQFMELFRGAWYTEDARSVTRHLVRRSELIIAFSRKAHPLALLLVLTMRANMSQNMKITSTIVKLCRKGLPAVAAAVVAAFSLLGQQAFWRPW